MSAPTTLVVPCFNEEHRLPVEDLRAGLTNIAGLGLLLVNDGSTDDTLRRLAAVRLGHEERVEVLDLARNGGKAEAVRLGMLRALRGGAAYVGFWDADLATPLDEVIGMRAVLDTRREVELVTGARIKLLGRRITRSDVRHYAGRVFATAVSMVLDAGVYDTQCGAKLFRAGPHLAGIFDEPFVSRWIFDVEILARMKNLSREQRLLPLERAVFEFPLERWEDVAGSKLRKGDFLRAALDLWKIRRRYRP